MVNPSTESILHQMTNLAMDIAMDHYAGDYVLPASPLSDVSKNDLYDFERDVFKNFKKSDNELLFGQCVAGSMGTARGCPGCPPTDLCKKDSYMGAASCDNCGVCLKKHPKPQQQFFSADGGPTPSSSSSSEVVKRKNNNHSAPAETTMDISWCQFEGCEFDTTDNSYLEIYDWIFYADRYALTDENREKVQKAFQMVPPSEVTGYVAEPPRKLTAAALPAAPKTLLTAYRSGDDDVVIPVPSATAADQMACRIKAEIKCESDDDYLWTSDNHMQPIILKAEPNADIQQITELDHSYLQTTNVCSSAASVSPVKHHPGHHLNVDLLGLVTPPPSRSQSSEEEEIDVVNDVDSWDAPTMADIMKRGIVVKKRDPPVTKLKNAVKRRYNRTSNSSTFPPMPPPPPKKLCNAGGGGGGGLSLMDRYKKTNWKDVPPAIPIVRETRPAAVPAVKNEPLDDDDDEECVAATAVIKPEIKSEPPSDDGEDECYDDDDDEDDEDNDMMMYDMDADFESLMKNEPDDLFDEDFDDDENDADWDKVFRRGSADSTSSRGCRYGGGKPSFGGGASSSSMCDGRKKKKKKATTSGGAATTKSSKHRHHHHHHHHQQHQQQHSSGVGKKIKYEGGTGGYSYKTKLMDPVKRALHNDLEKSRRVETSMLFMNLSMQVSFLDDNRKIPSKLSILRGAKRECDIQLLDERRLVSEKHAMQQKQRMLRERLFELRREQYHRRYGKTTTATAVTTVRQKQQQ